jgi:hypothetical protein
MTTYIEEMEYPNTYLRGCTKSTGFFGAVQQFWRRLLKEKKLEGLHVTSGVCNEELAQINDGEDKLKKKRRARLDANIKSFTRLARNRIRLLAREGSPVPSPALEPSCMIEFRSFLNQSGLRSI